MNETHDLLGGADFTDPPPRRRGRPAKQAQGQAVMPAPRATPMQPAQSEITPADQTLAMMAIIERLAANKDVDPDKLDRLIALQERIIDRNAKAAFDRELARMQSKLPVIDRKGRIEVREKDKDGKRTGDIQQSTPYAKWEDIVEDITPILGRHGFSLSFKPSNAGNGLVRIEATLAGHGHREITAIELQFDSTGSKNNVQAFVSSVSYGKRALGTAMLNIVSRGEDDDGKSSGVAAVIGDPLNAEQFAQVNDLCDAVECPKDRFLQHLNNVRPKGHPLAPGLAYLPQSRFDEAIAALRGYEANKKQRDSAAQQTVQPKAASQ